MKAGIALCPALVALPWLLCASAAGPTITVTDGSLSVLVTEVDDSIEITNTSTIAVIVFVRSPEGEQQVELAVGKRVAILSQAT